MPALKQMAYPMQALERLTSVDRDWHASIMFTYWLQFHLHKQLLEASSYAQAHGVVLKGDLPIGTTPACCRAGAGPTTPGPTNAAGCLPAMQVLTSAAWRPGCTPTCSA